MSSSGEEPEPEPECEPVPMPAAQQQQGETATTSSTAESTCNVAAAHTGTRALSFSLWMRGVGGCGCWALSLGLCLFCRCVWPHGFARAPYPPPDAAIPSSSTEQHSIPQPAPSSASDGTACVSLRFLLCAVCRWVSESLKGVLRGWDGYVGGATCSGQRRGSMLARCSVRDLLLASEQQRGALVGAGSEEDGLQAVRTSGTVGLAGHFACRT